MVSNNFQVLLQVFQMHVSSVSSVFKRVLQMLHLNVPEVDRVLHSLIAFCCFTSVSLPPPGTG
jgi:hypothetical protein